jgi:phosphatidylethanolamine-binding protein (PEBP) family uncharacterized protein
LPGNIPAHVQKLREALSTAPLKTPAEIGQDRNTRGSMGYFGPRRRTASPHHYHFQVFALDRMLDLQPAVREELLLAMEGHVLAADELVPTFSLQ